MFFTPHADDIEFGTPFMYIEALRLGYRVIEVVMTNNEFGTHRDEFKGHRLRKIREKELENANQIFEKYTNNKVEIIKLGYIDGHLPLNKDSVQKVVDLIRREKPAIIFTPDFWYTQDYHEDHLNTGRLVYFSLRKLKKSELPGKVFYYYSTQTRYYLKCRWRDFRIVREALSQHRSQFSPLEIKAAIVLYKKLSIFKHLLERRRFSESFREQHYHNNKPTLPPKFEEMSFIKRVIYYILSKITIRGYTKFHNLTPEEIGLR